MPAAASAPAPAAGTAAPAEEAAAPKEKTVFNVNLTKIDSAQKAKAIREVKALMPNMNLVEVSGRRRSGGSVRIAEWELTLSPLAPSHLCPQAKKFVESLPKTLKENATKEEAEKLQALMKAIGAEVTLD